MPFFFVFVGVLLIVTGVKDTHVALGRQIVKDFSGERNFFTWVLAIGAIGAIGYVDKLRPFANAFLVLVLVAMVLSNSNRGDILTRFKNGLNNPVPPARPTSTPAGTGTASRSSMTGNDALVKGKSILDAFKSLLGM